MANRKPKPIREQFGGGRTSQPAPGSRMALKRGGDLTGAQAKHAKVVARRESPKLGSRLAAKRAGRKATVRKPTVRRRRRRPVA